MSVASDLGTVNKLTSWYNPHYIYNDFCVVKKLFFGERLAVASTYVLSWFCAVVNTDASSKSMLTSVAIIAKFPI